MCAHETNGLLSSAGNECRETLIPRPGPRIGLTSSHTGRDASQRSFTFTSALTGDFRHTRTVHTCWATIQLSTIGPTGPVREPGKPASLAGLASCKADTALPDSKLTTHPKRFPRIDINPLSPVTYEPPRSSPECSPDLRVSHTVDNDTERDRHPSARCPHTLKQVFPKTTTLLPMAPIMRVWSLPWAHIVVAHGNRAVSVGVL